jgi:hypothetical protein
MEIEYTPLFAEARSIIGSGQTSANVTWEALIHYGTDQIYKPLAVISINTKRDYVDDFCDVVTVTLQIPLGDYGRLIYPNRVGLQMTLVKLRLQEGVDALDVDGPSESERYSAVLLDKDRSPTVAQGQEINDLNSMNLSQIIDVHFQIYDKAIEQVRVMDVGGIYRNCKMQDVVQTLLTNAVQTPKVSTERALVGVDMVPADNKDVKRQVVIPHNTRVFDVPGLLQYRYGIYNAGLGAYLQNKNWFVFPLYDTTEFHQRQKTLTLMVLPKRKFSNIERTFQVNGDSIIALVAGETGFRDDSGTNYLNAGNGARFTDADSLMDSPVSTGGNKATFKRDSNNSEFTAGEAVGVNNVTTSSRRITSNSFVTYSELAAKNGGMLRCVWQNSEPTLIIPGMVVKIIYVDGDTVKQVYGIVHQTNHISHRFSGYGNPRFKNQTVIDVFVNGQVTSIDA